MDVIVPGPMAVMKWIEASVRERMKAGITELEWVTPSGFVVTEADEEAPPNHEASATR